MSLGTSWEPFFNGTKRLGDDDAMMEKARRSSMGTERGRWGRGRDYVRGRRNRRERCEVIQKLGSFPPAVDQACEDLLL